MLSIAQLLTRARRSVLGIKSEESWKAFFFFNNQYVESAEAVATLTTARNFKPLGFPSSPEAPPGPSATIKIWGGGLDA
jgi:hypothetical protein